MISRETMIDACMGALGSPWPLRLWIAAMVLAAKSEMDDDWRHGAIRRLLKSPGKTVYER